MVHSHTWHVGARGWLEVRLGLWTRRLGSSMCLSMGCLDFLRVWRLSSKSKCPQGELSRSYIIIYDLGMEVNITLFSPWFKRREHRPHFLMGSVSKSQSKKSSWDGRYCNGHFGKYNQIYPACSYKKNLGSSWISKYYLNKDIIYYHPASGSQPFCKYPFSFLFYVPQVQMYTGH